MYRNSPHKNIQIITTNKGARIGKSFFDNNDELKKLYPSIEDFQKTHLAVLNEVETTGNFYRIHISENGIEVIPLAHL